MWFADLERMDARVIAVAVAITIGPALVMVWQARRMARSDLVQDWARSHSVVVPEEERGAIERHLRRLAWARGIGAASGWTFGSVIPLPAGPWGGMVLGYIACAIVAEATAPRLLGAGVTSVAARRLEAYVPTAAVSAMRALAAAPLLPAVLPLVVDRYQQAEGGYLRPLLVALVLLVLGITGEFTARRLVARRQSAGSAGLLSLDDALRSSSAHLLVASVLAAQLLGFGFVTAESGKLLASSVLRWVLVGISLCAGVASLATLHFLASRPWKVRRISGATA